MAAQPGGHFLSHPKRAAHRGLEALKNYGKSFPLQLLHLPLAAHRPAEHFQSVELAAHPHRGHKAVLLAEGDEIRPGEEIGEQIGHGKGLPQLQLSPAAPEILRQLAPAYVGAVAGQPQQHPGMEGLDAVVHPVLVQQLHRLFHQLADVEVVRLQFHQQGRPALEQVQDLLQQGILYKTKESRKIL